MFLFFNSAYLQYYIMGIILLPGLILAIYAQSKVTRTFNKYSKVSNSRGLSGAEVAKKILSDAGLGNIRVRLTKGHLSDHYNHRKKEIALSPEVHNSTSLSAVGVAAHEAGHALQYKDSYLPVKFRSALIPFSNLISGLLWPLVFIGILLNLGTEAAAGTTLGLVFVWSGISLFGLSVIVNLITLPVEMNASKRALIQLFDSALLDQTEIYSSKKVLNAAALTYIAALVVSILNLLRFLLYVISSRN